MKIKTEKKEEISQKYNGITLVSRQVCDSRLYMNLVKYRPIQNE